MFYKVLNTYSELKCALIPTIATIVMRQFFRFKVYEKRMA